jgi:hypothetical protein
VGPNSSSFRIFQFPGTGVRGRCWPGAASRSASSSPTRLPPGASTLRYLKSDTGAQFNSVSNLFFDGGNLFSYTSSMNEPKERRIGRPEGRRYEHARNIRLTAADAEEVRRLSEHWRTPEAEAIRRAIRETAKREGVTDGGAE